MDYRSKRDTNSPRDHPEKVQVIRSDFYDIRYIDEDVADVLLIPEGKVYDIGNGRHEYDVAAFVLRGVHVWPGLESYIRANYKMLCDVGEPLF